MIGIESIPDNFNQYRFGIQFLKNFYTAFDYEKNQIIIGLNTYGQLKDTQISKDPEGRIKKKKLIPIKTNYEGILNIIVVVIITVLLAIALDHYK